MKINDPNLVGTGVSSTGVSKSGQMGRTALAERPDEGQSAENADGDGVQLSNLVQSLGSLAAESPQRQAKVEALATAHANGSYSVDYDKIAAGMIHDAVGGH